MFCCPPNLCNIKQAYFHSGCGLRHFGKAIAALFRCRAGLLAIIAAVLAVFLLAGCGTGLPGAGLLKSVFSRKANAVAKNHEKETTLEDATVKQAQIEVVKTGAALKAAAAENPESRPVQVATRTNNNAAVLLNQREPLTVQEMEDAIGVVEGMLSAEVAKRTVAEKKQADAEAKNRDLGNELSKVRIHAIKLAKDAAAEAQRNMELANQLRIANIIKYSGIAASTLLGLAAIAYRLNIGRLQSSVANVIATVQQKHGDAAGDAARNAADAVLHTGEQKGVARAFFALTSK